MSHLNITSNALKVIQTQGNILLTLPRLPRKYVRKTQNQLFIFLEEICSSGPDLVNTISYVTAGSTRFCESPFVDLRLTRAHFWNKYFRLRRWIEVIKAIFTCPSDSFNHHLAFQSNLLFDVEYPVSMTILGYGGRCLGR